MRHKMSFLLVGLLVGSSAPLHAQLPDWVTQLLAAAQLPLATAQLRQTGTSNADVLAALDALRNAGVPAYGATSLFDTERTARRDNGPVNNFGAFVQSQLAAGKRGTDLAAAIHAEHARQGRGNSGGNMRAPEGSSGERGAEADGGRGRDRERGAHAEVDAGREPGAAADAGRGRGGRGKPPEETGAQDTKPGNRGRGRPPNR